MRLEIVLSVLVLVAVVGLMALGGFGLVRVGHALVEKVREAQASPKAPEPASAPEATVPEAPEPAVAEPAPVEPAPEADPSAPQGEAPSEPLVLVEPACKAQPRDHLRLDALVADEALARVWLDGFKPSLPVGTALPAPLVVQGLAVVVLARPPREDQPPRLCLDADQALADELALAATRPPPSPLGQGAWLVPATAPGTTVAALVAPELGKAFPTKGPLLAFAPTDNLVAFADSADATAVALAASTLSRLIGERAEDGCVTDLPLVRTRTGWTPWKAPPRHPASAELRAYAAQTLECRLALAVSVVGFARDQAGDAGVLGYELPELALAEPLSATDGAHRLVSLDGEASAQLLAGVDVVEADVPEKAQRLSMPWATFQRAAGKRLRPLELAHRKVPKIWRLEPGLSAAELANVPGVKTSPLPEATDEAEPAE